MAQSSMSFPGIASCKFVPTNCFLGMRFDIFNVSCTPANHPTGTNRPAVELLDKIKDARNFYWNKPKIFWSMYPNYRDEFYRTNDWIKLRAEVLEEAKYLCKNCGNKAIQVHHIKRLSDYPELGLTKSNLIAICTTCHANEHGK